VGKMQDAVSRRDRLASFPITGEPRRQETQPTRQGLMHEVLTICGKAQKVETNTSAPPHRQSVSTSQRFDAAPTLFPEEPKKETGRMLRPGT
jgi:hypothetical protein